MKVAIIGLGEVGRCFAGAWHDKGADVLLCEHLPSSSALDVVERTGQELHKMIDAWIGTADGVVICSTGVESKTISKQCSDLLRPGTWIADFTTADPRDKREAADTAAERGIHFADVAIMGGISLTHERTPLLACGSGALQLSAFLKPLGANLRVIDGLPGDAISLKLLRSVFTKGLEALAVEVLFAAEQQGVREQLHDVLSDIDRTPLRDFLNMVVRTHVIHAERRTHEVEQAGEQLARWGMPSRVLPGVRERFEATTKSLRRQPPTQAAPSIDEALEWFKAVHTTENS